MKLKLFPKTFLGALSLIVAIVIIAFALITILMPRFYRTYKEDTLNADLTALAAVLENQEPVEMMHHLDFFAATHDYSITLADPTGEVIFMRQAGMTMEQIGTGDGQMTIAIDLIGGSRTLRDADGRTLTLSLSSSVQPIDEAGAVILRVLPIVLLISIALGAAVSFVYAKMITRPIKAIGNATVQMRTLEKDAKCVVTSSDEIGELAGNINELYGRLLATINDLQTEMQNVTAADKEKIDFMLTVSHELKTPLTAVKGMIEGMQHNIGVYKDRDEYLARVGETIDALTALVNETLDASRLELSPAPEDFADTNLLALVSETAAAYEMIALSKQIGMDIDIAEDMSATLPAGLFTKALSNIISNAVKYADAGGAVRIYADGEALVIENTCAPLSHEEIRRAFEPFYRGGENGGHGLGLYLTERILKVCGLKFEFEPFEAGMRFVIYFSKSL